MKYISNNTEPYIEDEICDDSTADDPPVLDTSTHKFNPKLTLTPSDCLYDSAKPPPSDSKDFPSPSKLSINDEDLGNHNIPEDLTHPLFLNHTEIPFNHTIPTDTHHIIRKSLKKQTIRLIYTLKDVNVDGSFGNISKSSNSYNTPLLVKF